MSVNINLSSHMIIRSIIYTEKGNVIVSLEGNCLLENSSIRNDSIRSIVHSVASLRLPFASGLT